MVCMRNQGNLCHITIWDKSNLRMLLKKLHKLPFTTCTCLHDGGLFGNAYFPFLPESQHNLGPKGEKHRALAKEPGCISIIPADSDQYSLCVPVCAQPTLDPLKGQLCGRHEILHNPPLTLPSAPCCGRPRQGKGVLGSPKCHSSNIEVVIGAWIHAHVYVVFICKGNLCCGSNFTLGMLGEYVTMRYITITENM